MNSRQVWYSNNVDIGSPDTVHQVLMFGKLDDIKSLKKKVGEDKLKKLFLNHPKKIYTSAALNFIKNYILNISTPIDERQYLKFTPRVTR